MALCITRFAIIDGFFNLTYVRNPGAAFGIFAGNAEVFRRPFLILVSILASGSLSHAETVGGRGKRLDHGTTFILGGAIGNLIDRVFYGEVIDFLDVYWRNYHWPAFNVADSFITIGVALRFSASTSTKATIPSPTRRTRTSKLQATQLFRITTVAPQLPASSAAS